MNKLYFLISQTIAAVKKSKASLGDILLFPYLTFDTVVMSDVTNDDPGSDVDKEGGYKEKKKRQISLPMKL